MTNLIHTGTFDVENYGDLLFPEIVRKNFPQAKIRHISPAGSMPIWTDTQPCGQLTDLAHDSFHAVIVGGGNIIHTKRTVLSTYRAAQAELVGYADLWATVALATPDEVPVVWNAPGVADHFDPDFIPLVQEALLKTRYISVRDEESRACLLEIAPDLDIAVVPDSAWDLPTLYNSDQLSQAKTSALSRVGVGPEDPYLVFHLNKRYMQDIAVSHICQEIDEICGQLSARPLLIAFGPCHEDDKVANEVGAQLNNKPIILDRPNSIREVAGLVAGSQGYVGSSMHGYITAAAFGIPALVIASGKHKFQGVIRLTGAPETMQETWAGSSQKFLSYDTNSLSQKFKETQLKSSKALETHWSRIQSIIADAESKASPGKLDFEAVWRSRSRVLSGQLRDIERVKNIEKMKREKKKVEEQIRREEEMKKKKNSKEKKILPRGKSKIKKFIRSLFNN